MNWRRPDGGGWTVDAPHKHYMWIVWHHKDLLIGQRATLYCTTWIKTMPSKPLKRLFANFLICTLLCARLLYQAGPNPYIHKRQASIFAHFLHLSASFWTQLRNSLTTWLQSIWLRHTSTDTIKWFSLKGGFLYYWALYVHKRQTGEKGCLVLNDIDDLSKFWFCINIPQNCRNCQGDNSEEWHWQWRWVSVVKMRTKNVEEKMEGTTVCGGVVR